MDDYEYVVTYLVKGVKTTSRTVQTNDKYKSIYSMYPIYPIGCNSGYNFIALLDILKRYKDLMKPNEIDGNSKVYSKCIEELEDTSIGLFINHDKQLPFKYQGSALSDDHEITKLYNEIQLTFDQLFNFTQQTKKTATVPAKTITEKVAEKPPKAEEQPKTEKPPKAEKADDLVKENSADFDPTMWQKHVADFEATKPILEAEIKALEETLASQFDIVSSNRLKKRQRMLSEFPQKLATLKANLVAKQNYYTDGLAAQYKDIETLVNLYIDSNPMYFSEDGHTTLTRQLNTSTVIPHLARNPALFLKVESIVKDCRKKVNRLRVNKTEKETWVQNLEIAFTALKEEVVKSKYYINIIGE